MKAGLLLLPHDPPARLVELAALAEGVGYDHFWLADERFFREVYGSLTLAAHHTSRITVGAGAPSSGSAPASPASRSSASSASGRPGRSGRASR